MSWGEVKKINNNMKKALNEQMRDLKFQPLRVITSSVAYTPEKTGLYKIICVGSGGDGFNNDAMIYSGGGGGVAIKTMHLEKTSSYNITVSTTASFGDILTATAASDYLGGTASGGDYNFEGEGGVSYTKVYTTHGVMGGSVGVMISDLCRQRSYVHIANETSVTLTFGDSILNYGGGAPAGVLYSGGNDPVFKTEQGLPACVIVIPLEMEE